MKLAYSSNAYTRTDLDSALKSISGLGFEAAEILCDYPHLFPGRTPQAYIGRLRQQLDTLGLKISNLNANTANQYFDPMPAENLFEPSLSSANPEHRRWRIEYSIEAIRVASSLGARCISLTSGHPGSGGLPAQGMRFFIDGLKQICEAAEQHGVQVGIEYEPGLLVEAASEVMETIQRVGSERLGVNLDIGHSWLNREQPEQTIALLAGRIWNVHVEDIANHKHFHLIPGEGDMPLQRYLAALQQAGYDNYLTVELYTYTHQPEQAGRNALSYLKKLLLGQEANHA